MKFKDEDLQPVGINVPDFEQNSYYFIDMVNFNNMLIYIFPILFYAFIIVAFSFHKSVIPFEQISETSINQTETEDKFDIDFSVYNISSLNKFLKVKFYAVQNKELNDRSLEDTSKKLNISFRYVLQKNYEVIDSNTSLSEEINFYFTNNSNISRPIHLFQHVAGKFDYVNIHLYMNGDFHLFQKFIFKYKCSNAEADNYIYQALLTSSLISLGLLLTLNPRKLNIKRVKYNLLLMNLASIFMGIPMLQDKQNLLFAIYAALLRYFLLSQVFMINFVSQSRLVDLTFVVFSGVIFIFEYKSLEARYDATFLPIKKQAVVLTEEIYMMTCDFIFAIILSLLIALVWIKGKEIPINRFRFLIISSIIIIFSSFYYQIISVFNFLITKTNTIKIIYLTMFITIGSLSFILFGPGYEIQYRQVDKYDTNLDVDPISDE